MTKRTCICCKSNRRLPCIGQHRKNGCKKYADWLSRKFHKKCYIMLKKQHRIYLDLNKSNHINKLQIMVRCNAHFNRRINKYYVNFPKNINDDSNIKTKNFYILLHNFY